MTGALYLHIAQDQGPYASIPLRPELPRITTNRKIIEFGEFHEILCPFVNLLRINYEFFESGIRG